MTITDDYSRYTFVFPLASKTETISRFHNLDNLLYNQFARHASIIRSDNGTEFKNNSFSEYCRAYGITQQYTTPYASSQNGVSERMNLTLLNPVRAMLKQSGLSQTYWVEALRNAANNRNRSPSAKTGSKTPYELFYGVPPQMDHLQIFGSPCYALTTSYQRRNTGTFKLADRSEQCVFLGYSTDSKSYRLLQQWSNKIITRRYEDTIFTKTADNDTTDSPKPDLPPAQSVTITLNTAPTPVPQSLPSPTTSDDSSEYESLDNQPSPSIASSPAPSNDHSSYVCLQASP
jgi:hypothetical protein